MYEKGPSRDIVVFLGFGVSYFINNQSAIGESEVSEYYYGSSIIGAQSITCTYPQLLSTSYISNAINHTLPNPETNPIIMTYSDFDDEYASVKFIDATQTISELPLIKIFEDDEKLVFLEGANESYTTLHTIYLKEGVSIYSKEASLLGIPISSTGMGTCIDM